MNLESLDKSLSESPLSTINTGGLVLLIVLSCLVGYTLLRLTKNQYDGSLLIKRYLLYLIPHLVLGFLFKIPVLLIIGTYLLGGIFTYFKSNQLFYE